MKARRELAGLGLCVAVGFLDLLAIHGWLIPAALAGAGGTTLSPAAGLRPSATPEQPRALPGRVRVSFTGTPGDVTDRSLVDLKRVALTLLDRSDLRLLIEARAAPGAGVSASLRRAREVQGHLTGFGVPRDQLAIDLVRTSSPTGLTDPEQYGVELVFLRGSE